METEQQPELTSWKEIADRLQVTVRTAQEWEKKRGLPVRRVPGGGRGRVYLRVADLEAWLDGQLEVDAADGAAARQAAPVPDAASFKRRLPLWAGVAGVVVIGAAAAWLLLGPTPGGPIDMRVLPREIVALGEQGEELWRAEIAGGLNESSYERREHNAEFVDVDGDGVREMLFVLRPENRAQSAVLVCFDETGEEMWRFTPGAPVESGDEVFADTYQVSEFRFFAMQDGTRAVVLTGAHHLLYPTQVVVLSAVDGRALSEYWHSGHIGTEPAQLVVADANLDRVPEIYLAGISNAHKRATLVVLDPLTMQGASAEVPGYQLRGFAPPREIARILFRRSAVNRAEEEYNLAAGVWASPEFVTVSVEEGMRHDAGPGVIYNLLPDLTFDHLSLNSSYPMVHNGMLEEGRVDIDLEEQRRALSGVDYVVGPPPALAEAGRGR